MFGLIQFKRSEGGRWRKTCMSLPLLWALLEVVSGASVHPRGHSSLHAIQGIAECSSLALTSNCEYYACLDQTLGCRKRQGFAHSFGLMFCERVQKGIHHFTDEGVQWADRVNTCILKSMAVQVTDSSSCSSRGLPVTALYACSENDDICQRLVTDKEAVLQLFSYRNFMTLVQAASHCDRHIVNPFIHWGMRNMFFRRSHD